MNRDTFTTFFDHPIDQFKNWYGEVEKAQASLPEAMSLATANKQGRPSVRLVLLKGVDMAGFTFFTNYESRKAHELIENPYAALCFHWTPLERQVRVEGSIEKTSEHDSDVYWMSRPRESRLSALASFQSHPISSRDTLMTRVESLKKEYDGKEIPRPKFWGGFRLTPHHIEFWQGQPHRMHDRLSYTLASGRWVVERLQP